MTYLWNADLVTFLEELGVLLDEFLGGHVLDGHTLLVVDTVHVQLISIAQSECFSTTNCTYVHLCVRLSFLFN